MKKKHLTIIAIILMAMVSGLLVYLFILPANGKIRLPMVEGCLLHSSPCEAVFPEGVKMMFEITPRNPVATDALNLHISFEGIEPQAVSVRFKGENMDMGYLEYLKYPLARFNMDSKSILFTGKGGVFACSTGRMRWFALVDVEIGETVYEVPFRFETTSKSN